MMVDKRAETSNRRRRRYAIHSLMREPFTPQSSAGSGSRRGAKGMRYAAGHTPNQRARCASATKRKTSAFSFIALGMVAARRAPRVCDLCTWR
jgi:hypothetical protein